MPATKRPKPLYQRGKFKLYAREGRNLEIVWYCDERKRERSASAGTADLEDARLELDRLFLSDTGHSHCPTCHRPWDNVESPLLARVIADYLIRMKGREGFASARSRLNHVLDYLEAVKADTRVIEVDTGWIEAFRKWLLARPYAKGGQTRERSIGAVEGSVLQLAAAINAAPGLSADFKAEQMKAVAQSPRYRASIQTIAKMFDYCLRPDLADTEHHFQPGRVNEKYLARRIEERANLLRYLRAAVATWARPDAIYAITERQWFSDARVLDLNPPNRRQTKKHRPKVPVAKQFAPFLDEMKGAYLPVASVRASWEKMRAKLGLPEDREAGEKLVRRSVSTIARRKIGEAQWRQGEMMLGHVKASISDIYAIPDPANLGLALQATESIIDEIEKLAPGAFKTAAYRAVTATGKPLGIVEGGKSA